MLRAWLAQHEPDAELDGLRQGDVWGEFLDGERAALSDGRLLDDTERLARAEDEMDGVTEPLRLWAGLTLALPDSAFDGVAARCASCATSALANVVAASLSSFSSRSTCA